MKHVSPFAVLVCMTLCILSGCAGEPNVIVTTDDNEYAFSVAYATTVEQWRRGLMDKQKLSTRGGMLFVYPDARERTFWMKNTTLPLTLLFFDDNRTLLNIVDARPCRSDPCPKYLSAGKAQFVLEINHNIIPTSTEQATLSLLEQP